MCNECHPGFGELSCAHKPSALVFFPLGSFPGFGCWLGPNHKLTTFYDRSIAGVAVIRGPGHPAGKVGGDPLASAKAWMAATDPHND